MARRCARVAALLAACAPLCVHAQPAPGAAVLTLEAADVALHGQGGWAVAGVAPRTGALLQPVGAWGFAPSSGGYTLLAGVEPASANATLLSVAFGGGSASYANAPGLALAAAAASGAATVVGVRPAAGGFMLVRASGAAQQLSVSAAGALPDACSGALLGASALDAARSVLHLVCCAALGGTQTLVSLAAASGTLVASVMLPPVSTLALWALAVEPVSGAVVTLGCAQHSGAVVQELGIITSGAYSTLTTSMGATSNALFAASKAAATQTAPSSFSTASVFQALFAVATGGSEALRTVSSTGGVVAADTLLPGRLLDVFVVRCGAAGTLPSGAACVPISPSSLPPPPPSPPRPPPPSPAAVSASPLSPPSPPLSLASLSSQLAALQAALPPTCAGNSFLQRTAGGTWACTAPVRSAATGGFCRADADGSLVCNAAPPTPPDCMPPGAARLAFSSDNGAWLCVCNVGWSGASCNVSSGSGGDTPKCVQQLACSTPGWSGFYRLASGVMVCDCLPGFSGATCVQSVP